VQISAVRPEFSTITLEVGAVGRDGVLVPCPAILPELGAIVSKILTVLVDVAPVVLDVLGHLSEALGTCTGDPERHSH